MTENEAKTKWCPMARKLAHSGDDGFVACNRDADGGLAACIASECMWWMWDCKDLGPASQDEGHCGAAK